MKKNYLRAMAVAAFAILAGYNVYLAQLKTNDEMSDLLAANMEALSQNEEDGGGGEAVIVCSRSCRDGIGQCWKSCKDAPLYCERTESAENHCSCTHLPG